jgi:hypothetical protein
LEVNGKRKEIRHSSQLDEYGKRSGDPLPAVFRRQLDISRKACASTNVGPVLLPDRAGCTGGVFQRDPAEEVITPNPDDVSATWTFLTVPRDAQPRGKIRTSVSTSLSGTMRSKVIDQELFQGGVSLSLNVSVTVSALGFGVSFPLQRGGGDDAEGTAALSWAFASDDLGTSHPNAVGNKHLQLSSEENSTQRTTKMKFSVPPRQMTKIKGSESRARYQTFMELTAFSSRGLLVSSAEGAFEDTLVTLDYGMVRYVP